MKKQIITVVGVAALALCVSHVSAFEFKTEYSECFKKDGNGNLCLPAEKPGVCNGPTWKALQDPDRPKAYPPCLAAVNGCYIANEDGNLCLPAKKPKACDEKGWKALQNPNFPKAYPPCPVPADDSSAGDWEQPSPSPTPSTP